MFITCSLDSEHYSDPWINARGTLEEAKKKAIEDCTWYFDDKSDAGDLLEIEDKPVEYSKRLIRVSIDDRDEFIVSEIFEIPDESKALVVWHHAYDGVDFKVDAYFNMNEAGSAMEEATKKEIEDIGGEEDEDYYFDNTIYGCGCGAILQQFIIDTGEEWEVLTLVKMEDK